MNNSQDMESIQPALNRLEALADLMDARFQIPGLPFRFGLDAIIGLIPVLGDTVNLSVSGYIVAEAVRLGARKRDLVRMLVNIFLDWLIGLVPIIGDIFDVTWKGNLRNIAILKKAIIRNSNQLNISERRRFD